MFKYGGVLVLVEKFVDYHFDINCNYARLRFCSTFIVKLYIKKEPKLFYKLVSNYKNINDVAPILHTDINLILSTELYSFSKYILS